MAGKNYKELVFITAAFPFGGSEAFIENEIHFLANHFEYVHIVSRSEEITVSRVIPDNCTVHHFPAVFGTVDKLKSLLLSSNALLKDELEFAQDVLDVKPDKGVKKIAMASLYQARRLQHFLEKRFAKASDSTLFYSYWLDDSAIALALMKDKNPDLTTVSRVHGWDLHFERHPFHFLPFRKLLFEQMDAVFSISAHGIDYLADKISFSKKKLKLSRLGTLDHGLGPNNDADEFRIFSCSSLIPLKRVDQIIESIALIDKPVKWIHAGGGILMNELKVLAESKLGNKPDCSFEFLGQVTNAAVLDFYKNSSIDLFINLSTTEGLPVSMMEAISFGVPVLGTDVGGVHEIVLDEKNGFLVDVESSPEQVASVINKFFELDKNSRDSFRQEARKHWEDCFNAKKNYTDFIQEMISL